MDGLSIQLREKEYAKRVKQIEEEKYAEIVKGNVFTE
jgi:hypothetical protein